MAKERLYTLSTLPTFVHYIYTGVSIDGKHQVLVVNSRIQKMMVAVIFDMKGKMLKTLEESYEDIDRDAHYSEQAEKLFEVSEKLRQKVGLIDFNNIRVKKFWVDGHMIGIHDYPMSLQYMLKEPEITEEQFALTGESPDKFAKLLSKSPSPEQRTKDWEQMRSWKISRDFIFWGGRTGIMNDYWANDNGIHST